MFSPKMRKKLWPECCAIPCFAVIARLFRQLFCSCSKLNSLWNLVLSLLVMKITISSKRDETESFRCVLIYIYIVMRLTGYFYLFMFTFAETDN